MCSDRRPDAPIEVSDTSVYVHFPWCLKKCPYCDFATRSIEPGAIPHAAYADAVLRELEAKAPALEGRRLVSIFVGGGTPSLRSPTELGRVVRAAKAAFPTTTAELEVTVECNPSSLDEARVAALTAEGVNRLSVGVQSLRDHHLRHLGRVHDRAGALEAVRAATEGAPRASADLMFGMPGQTLDELMGDVALLLELGVEHLSAYALTIEPGTQFGELHKKGRLPVAPEEDYAALFEAAEGALAEAGLDHYEVSNYALPGAESRHNLHYWRTGSYLGLGAGAVGCLREVGHGTRTKNVADASTYMPHAHTEGREAEREEIDGAATVREALMLGLRTREGVDLGRLRRFANREPLEGREARLRKRIERGDLTLDGDILRVPAARWLLLDGIIADLF